MTPATPRASPVELVELLPEELVAGLAAALALGAAMVITVSALAAAAADQQPTPLEGLATDQLLASLRSALGAGLVDDLSFLSRPDAAAALFELAGALPPSPEKRELGRRVLVALHEGDAATFVTLATALALSSPRALGGPLIRARVALSLRLPLSSVAHVDGLALALVSRPELERDWLSAHSIGALPARRLAARLLEQRPLVKVLYTSGYPAGAFGSQGVLDPGMAYLPKPFTAAQLVLKLRQVIEAR